MSLGDKFYTTSGTERDAVVAGGYYTYDEVACYVHSDQDAAGDRLPLFRLSNATEHFYTINPSERSAFIARGYRDEGIACYVGRHFVTDELLTTSEVERDNAQNNLGFHWSWGGYVFRNAAGDRLYTTSDLERDAAIQNFGYVLDNDACFVHATQRDGTVPLYRLANGVGHFYTISPAERDSAISTQRYMLEGETCYVYETMVPNSIPLYRLAHVLGYLYTTSEEERDLAVSQYGYVSDGIACYVPSGPSTETVPLHRLSHSSTLPLYRLYHPDGRRLLTTSTVERDQAVGLGFNDEGIACYVPDRRILQTQEMGRWRVGVQFLYDPLGDPAFFRLLGYTLDTVSFYYFGNQVPGTIPIFRLSLYGPGTSPFLRMRKPSSGLHFYTVDPIEAENARLNLNYEVEGNAGFVWNNPSSETIPLYRLTQTREPPPPSGIESFSLTPATVQLCLPTTVTLHWTVVNVERVEIRRNGILMVPSIANPSPNATWSGSVSDPVQQQTNATYELTAFSSGGSSQRSIALNVTSSIPVIRRINLANGTQQSFPVGIYRSIDGALARDLGTIGSGQVMQIDIPDCWYVRVEARESDGTFRWSSNDILGSSTLGESFNSTIT